MKNYICIDVGGTAVKYGLLNAQGEILAKGEVPTPDNMEDFLQVIDRVVEEYRDFAPSAISMSAPGRIDRNRGYFHTSGSLCYIDQTDLKSLVESRSGLPFYVQNDAKAAAQAEAWNGCMQDTANGVVMTLGTGVGGGIVLNGKVYNGFAAAAGEFSSMPQDIRGTTPEFVGGFGGTRGLLEYHAQKCGQWMDGRAFFEKVYQGDPAACDSLQTYASWIARMILNIQAVLDVQKFAIGGGISRQPVLIEKINEELDRLIASYPIAIPILRPEVTACKHSSDANLVGALAHALEYEE